MAWKVKKSATHKFERYIIIKDEVILPNKEEKTFADTSAVLKKGGAL
jgi:hypothetical protein